MSSPSPVKPKDLRYLVINLGAYVPQKRSSAEFPISLQVPFFQSFLPSIQKKWQSFLPSRKNEMSSLCLRPFSLMLPSETNKMHQGIITNKFILNRMGMDASEYVHLYLSKEKLYI